jgi:4-diphosphocytidyl-2-C-methyl-D-erythritol kinase
VIQPVTEPISVKAHAKVNLALAVGPPIPAGQPHAGFHPIASWMHAIDLADELTVTPASETIYDLAWSDGTPFAWPAESDLCVRAHRALQAHAGRELPAGIILRKSIPDGGGLGGGSSNAGALLLALRDLFRLPTADAELVGIAHALGTDIPFFLDPLAWLTREPPRPALVTGLGDRLDRLPRRSGRVTLICPPFGCPTAAVYRAFDARPAESCDEARVRAVAGEPAHGAALFNDLVDAAERAEPRLGPLRRAIASGIGRPVHLSGSGSTLFCFVPARIVRPLALGCRVIEARLV